MPGIRRAFAFYSCFLKFNIVCCITTLFLCKLVCIFFSAPGSPYNASVMLS